MVTKNTNNYNDYYKYFKYGTMKHFFFNHKHKSTLKIRMGMAI